MESPSKDLVARWRTGDELAATELFHRYRNRLCAFVRSRFSRRLAGQLEPEDVVQSAFRSFFTRTREGAYQFPREGDLWRLLVAITFHKLKHQADHHAAEKRDLARHCTFSPTGSTILGARLASRDPTPSANAAFEETLAQLFDGLEPIQKRIVELRLQGFHIEEIADDIQRSERTVRRCLEQVKARFDPLFDRP